MSAKYRARMENYFVACLLEIGPPPEPPGQLYRGGIPALRDGSAYNYRAREWFVRQHLRTITGPDEATCYKFSNQYRRWLAIHASKKHDDSNTM